MSKKKGLARLQAIFRMLAPHVQGVVVDVGCDHGQLTGMIQNLVRAEGRQATVIGIERRGHRLPSKRSASGYPMQLMVADGMRGLRRVDACVIAGMGPHTILEILAAGPSPMTAVVHSPDRTDTLRRGLKKAGWRIVEESLAPENNRCAEILRIEPGVEHSTGHTLLFGPRLLEFGDPLLAQHVAWVRRHWSTVARSAPGGSHGHTRATEWVDFIDGLQLPEPVLPSSP
jgi:tRNA A22 N-methylase